ncbi:MAG: hypothetical protein VX427_17555 [Acidobacteriota bacterium]|nr:hypothetical protein [Acidobacteriota bacterium]
MRNGLRAWSARTVYPPGRNVAAVVVVQGVDELSVLEQLLMLTQGPVGAIGRDDEFDARRFHRTFDIFWALATGGTFSGTAECGLAGLFRVSGTF